MASLARRDPAALEALRERLTHEVIRRAPTDDARRRLEGLKFRIDMERRRTPDPLAACVRISALMHCSLADLKIALSDPGELLDRRQTSRGATLLAFPDAGDRAAP
jgi:hypothetical protein